MTLTWSNSEEVTISVISDDAIFLKLAECPFQASICCIRARTYAFSNLNSSVELQFSA